MTRDGKETEAPDEPLDEGDIVVLIAAVDERRAKQGPGIPDASQASSRLVSARANSLTIACSTGLLELALV
jgi:hypothetical protein